ncbi:MAG TPA: EAL domain-containing protein [Acidiferrobacterales bacterium]|jgi:diguanylate cyclase (GGDEF)-like protein/PAS domain S-box-containing protein
MNKTVLPVLILDDSPDDAEQTVHVLRQGGWLVKSQRVDTPTALAAALDAGDWPVMLAETNLPTLSIELAIQTMRNRDPAAICIVVAGRMGDDEIGRMMALGAQDVVTKGRYGRLVPLLRRELALRDERRAFRAAAERLGQLEERYRSVVAGSLEAVAYCHDGIYVDANPAYLALLGCTGLDELKDIPVLNLIDKPDQARFKAALRNGDGGQPQEFVAVTRDGRKLAVEIALSPLTLGGEDCLQLMVRDVSRRKTLETKLQYLHQKDALTGLSNRRSFVQEIGKALERVRASDGQGQLLGMELHALRDLNVKLGHTVCDRFLLTLTRTLREFVDARHPLARVGGGQFAALLDDVNAADAEYLKQRIEGAVRALKLSAGGKNHPFRFALKLVSLDAANDGERLLAQAFAAMPASAAAPPVRPAPPAVETVAALSIDAAPAAIEPLTPIAPTPPPTRMPAPALAPARAGAHGNPDWSEAVAAALREDKLALRYQPVISVLGEPRELYELSLRLDTGHGTTLDTEQILAAALRAGLATKLDRCLAQRSIDQLARHAADKPGLNLLLTLTPAAITDATLLTAMQAHLRATGTDANALFFQIDAALAEREPAAVQGFVHQARKLGAGIVIDNFTGKTPAEALADLEIDFVAIDCGNAEAMHSALFNAKKQQRTIIGKRLNDGALFAALFTGGAHYAHGDFLAPPTAAPDYQFADEHTLSSEPTAGFGSFVAR